jgi:hypothetical protein
MFILFIPAIYSTTDYVSRGIGHFDTFTLSSNLILRDSFNLLDSPLIRFENKDANVTNEFMLITPDKVSYKSYLLFGSERNLVLDHTTDLTSDAKAKSWLVLLFFFILPSLLFWSIILSVVYFTIMILITLIVMLMISSVFRINIRIVNLLKLCIYSSTIFILLQLLLMPFYRVLALPLAIYWLLILVTLFVLRDIDTLRTSNERRNNNSKNYSSESSKTESIFGSSHKFSNAVSKNSVSKQDSYDIDENGNLKGSSKKSKYRGDEDDGYVELK